MDNMRNIIRLKDIPSNVIEEAIIVFKENKKAKKYEYLSKFEKNNAHNINDKDYIVKEAELIISKYINPEKNKEKELLKKLKNQKIIIIGLGIFLFISILL